MSDLKQHEAGVPTTEVSYLDAASNGTRTPQDIEPEYGPTARFFRNVQRYVWDDPDKPKADETSDKPKTADKPAKPDAKKTIPVKKGKH